MLVFFLGICADGAPARPAVIEIPAYLAEMSRCVAEAISNPGGASRSLAPTNSKPRNLLHMRLTFSLVTGYVIDG
jgi:hypothetical protein